MPVTNVILNAVRGGSVRDAVCDWPRNGKVYARVQDGCKAVVQSF